MLKQKGMLTTLLLVSSFMVSSTGLAMEGSEGAADSGSAPTGSTKSSSSDKSDAKPDGGWFSFSSVTRLTHKLTDLLNFPLDTVLDQVTENDQKPNGEESKSLLRNTRFKYVAKYSRLVMSLAAYYYVITNEKVRNFAATMADKTKRTFCSSGCGDKKVREVMQDWEKEEA